MLHVYSATLQYTWGRTWGMLVDMCATVYYIYSTSKKVTDYFLTRYTQILLKTASTHMEWHSTQLVETKSGLFVLYCASTVHIGDSKACSTHVYSGQHWELTFFLNLLPAGHCKLETKSDIHAVKYTTCLAHHTNMPHVTTHQLVTHGSRQG